MWVGIGLVIGVIFGVAVGVGAQLTKNKASRDER